MLVYKNSNTVFVNYTQDQICPQEKQLEPDVFTSDRGVARCCEENAGNKCQLSLFKDRGEEVDAKGNHLDILYQGINQADFESNENPLH